MVAKVGKALFSGWGWFLALGIILIITGAMVIISPLTATLAIEVLLGWILIINGILAVIHSFGSQDFGGFIFRLLLGVITVIFGGLILSNILVATIALTVLLAAFLLVEGIFKIIASFQIRETKNWAWLLISGILALVLGIIWLKWPLSAAWVIGLFIGIDLVFGGWALVMLALSLRK